MCKILNGVQPTYVFDLMLEIKNDGEEFPVYKPGGKFYRITPLFCFVRFVLMNTGPSQWFYSGTVQPQYDSYFESLAG